MLPTSDAGVWSAVRPRASARSLMAHGSSQLLIMTALWFVPAAGALSAWLQSLGGAAAAAFAFVGLRRFRPEPGLAWRMIVLGLFVSAWGNVVELAAMRWFGVRSNPNVADILWLCLHAGLVAGLGMLAHRRALGEELGTSTLNTIVCALLNLFVGVFAWQSIVWRSHNDLSLTVANRFIVTLYPLADLMVIAIIVRLLLGGGLRNGSLLLVTAAMGWFLASDVGWSDFIRSNAFPDRWREYFVEASGLAARAIMATAFLVPSVRTAAAPEGGSSRLGPLGWLGLAASILTAPLVLLLQALLDRLYSVSSF